MRARRTFEERLVVAAVADDMRSLEGKTERERDVMLAAADLAEMAVAAADGVVLGAADGVILVVADLAEVTAAGLEMAVAAADGVVLGAAGI